MKTTAVSCLPRPPDIIRAQCPETKATADGMYPFIGFPYYIPFLSDYLWKLNNILFTTFSWIYTDLVDYRAEAEIFVHTWNTDHNEIRSYTKDGVYISAWTVAACPDRCNILCADVNNNVYLVDTNTAKIYKYDSAGTLLVTKTVDAAEAITAGPDGYIYELGYDGLNPRIIKRDPTDLSNVATMSGLGLTIYYEGFTCDSNGDFYLYKNSTDEIEKWDFANETELASHASPIVGSGLCVIGSVLGGVTQNTEHAFTMSTSLDTDQTAWDLSEVTRIGDVSVIDEHFLFGGYNSGDSNEKLTKYNSSKVNAWSITVGNGTDFNVTGVAAYPF